MATLTEPSKKEVADIWDVHSISYDRAGGRIHSGPEKEAWRAYIAKEIPAGKLNVLDVGCGTGEISLLMAAMGHKVTGIDISEKMMQKGIAKAQEMGLAIDFRSGDAEHTGFDADSFDVVICRFLLWTLPNPQGALNEWHRILRPGGRVLIIDGKWRDYTVSFKLTMKLSQISIRIIDGRRPMKNYSEGLARSLNMNGVPTDTARKCLKGADFKNISIVDLEEVRRIKLKSVPWRYRAGIGRRYYLITGKKLPMAVVE
ncbi:MAG: class I SAM-dependent methyltransferase [Candidatus Bathyarchaeia archaeon]|jgi:ubiquinone/menaquinone biosynthesis C-methylase UbiE